MEQVKFDELMTTLRMMREDGSTRRTYLGIIALATTVAAVCLVLLLLGGGQVQVELKDIGGF